MIDAVIAAICSMAPADFAVENGQTCEAQFLPLTSFLMGMPDDDPSKEEFEKNIAETLLKGSPVPRARLLIDTVEDDATVLLFRDGAVFPTQVPPPPDRTCKTPCDILVENLAFGGFVFLLQGDIYQTLLLTPRDMDTAEWKDGVATYSIRVDVRRLMLEAQARLQNEYLEQTEGPFDCNRKIPEGNEDAVPCVRMAPVMPPDAERSGYCEVVFDINRKGRPYNINAQLCSEETFRDPTEITVGYWRYKPAMENGRPVTQKGVRNKVSFRLSDESGLNIPEQ